MEIRGLIISATLLSSCLPPQQPDETVEALAQRIRLVCNNRSPEECEELLDRVANKVCPGTDSVRNCLRYYVRDND